MNLTTTTLAAGLTLGLALGLTPIAEAQITKPVVEPNLASIYGPGDTLGAANLLSPEKVLEAIRLVKKGKTYPLGIVTNRDTPAFGIRGFEMNVVQPGQIGGATLGSTKTSYNDDIVYTWLGIGSQIDGLGHIGVDNVYYNNLKGADFAQPGGLTALGVESLPPFVTRGVVLDMTKHFNVDMVPEGTAFNRAEIDAAAKAAGVKIGKGDVVLFHTNWLSIIKSDPDRFKSVEPGLGLGGAAYLAALGVVAVGADTWGLEVLPFEKGAGVFEVHQVLIAHNGVYILENMNTGPLVRDGVTEFMFVLGAARMAGSVQMMINPVAIN